MSDQGYEPTRVGQPVGPAATGATPPGGYGGLPPQYPPAPDRRPWIIGGLVVAIIIVILAIVLVSGDDDDDDLATDSSTTSSSSTSSTSSSSTSSTSSTTSTTGTSTTSTTVAATTTTTEAPPVTLDIDDCANAADNPANAAPAAQKVYEAWTLGDRDCAEVLMTTPALDELFARDGSEATFEFQSCGPAQDAEYEQDCAFFTEGTGMHFLMNFSDTEGWKVVVVEQTAD